MNSTSARIALLQLPAFDIADAEASLVHTLRLIDDAAQQHPDITVLPEVTYPAYFLGARELPPAVRTPAEALETFASKAREHRVYIAAGMALDASGGGYANGAALFGRDGALVGTYAKSFLWQFDNRWFAPGDAYPVFETDVGRIGMLVCADGRLPEIARSLVLNGAQVLLDLTAWVSTGRRSAELTSIQREYLMPVRAMENGVWVVAADKCGVEAESIVYCGRSCVISPHGEVVATLASDEEGILVHDVPIGDPGSRMIRRPDLYAALVHPTESLPVLRTLDESLVLENEDHRVATVQMTMPPDAETFLVEARRHVERLAMQDAEVVLFPATPSRYRWDYPHDSTLAALERLAADAGVCIAFTISEPDADVYRAMYLVGPRGVIAKHRQTHKPHGPRFETMPLGDEVCPIVNTPIGRVGLLIAAEGFVPEVPRSLMLRGAEIILWAGDDPPSPMLPFARCRAEENVVFVACSGAPSANGAAAICAPDGRVLAAALAGRELSVAATVNRALTHRKTKAPGTDVVRNRQPATYGALVRATPPEADGIIARHTPASEARLS